MTLTVQIIILILALYNLIFLIAKKKCPWGKPGYVIMVAGVMVIVSWIVLIF